VDGSDFWGVLDRVSDGLSSTGNSVLKGAGELANTYEHYFGGQDRASTPREEHTTDKTDELRTVQPLGSPAWYQQPGYLIAVVGLTGVLVLLLTRLK
jgi:hypothetical protein